MLGSLAGVDFSAAAIAARPLTNEHTLTGFLGNPLLYLLLIHSLVGQLLLGLAMLKWDRFVHAVASAAGHALHLVRHRRESALLRRFRPRVSAAGRSPDRRPALPGIGSRPGTRKGLARARQDLMDALRQEEAM